MGSKRGLSWSLKIGTAYKLAMLSSGELLWMMSILAQIAQTSTSYSGSAYLSFIQISTIEVQDRYFEYHIPHYACFTNSGTPMAQCHCLECHVHCLKHAFVSTAPQWDDWPSVAALQSLGTLWLKSLSQDCAT